MPAVDEGRKDDDAPPSLGVTKVINTFEFAGGTARIACIERAALYCRGVLRG